MEDGRTSKGPNGRRIRGLFFNIRRNDPSAGSDDSIAGMLVSPHDPARSPATGIPPKTDRQMLILLLLALLRLSGPLLLKSIRQLRRR